jgi:uncharacterized membrane protein
MTCRKILNSKTGAAVMAAMMATTLIGAVPVYAEKEDEDASTQVETELQTEEETQAEEAQTTTAGNGQQSTTIDMTTSYPGVTVKSGETVSFSLDFSSLDGAGHDVSLSAESLPEGWEGYFKGGNYQITQVHVDAPQGDDQSAGEGLATYSISVPAEATEGTYEVALVADDGDGDLDELTLEILVTTEEVGDSTFTSEYPQQQGATGSTFTFDTTIVNNRGVAQTYSLSAETIDGWQVSFVPSGESSAVTSLEVEAGSSQGVTVTVVPPTTVEKGEYTIPCSAISANDTLKQELSVDITGTYSVALSTSDGRLSFDAYADKASSVTLTVTNSGNVDLTNLNLSSSAPTGWDVTFSESSIDTLEAGATKEITATVTPSEDVITGDYVTAITISNSETSAEADFRVSVKTPTTWGYAAVGIIVVLLAVLAAIFKKYGRR